MNVVVVGCGVAGVTAAITIRQNDLQAMVTMYTDEKRLYYPRPELYRVLSGEVQSQEIIAFPEQWYKEGGITVYLGKKVSKIDIVKKELLLEDGSRAIYDKLLLTNGAHPFVPPIKGVDKTGVFSLRSVEDAVTIRDYAKKMTKAIVIGGGLLGLEFAASLRKLGLEVEVVEIFPRLLPMQLDADGASVLKDRIAALGIGFELGVKTVEILGKESVSGIALDNGKQLSGDFVLFSAGIRSNIELAAEAGIKVNRGVVVDQYLQTNANDVYAAGDVAEFEGRVYGIIPAAEEQARIAAVNLVGDEKQVYKGTIPSNTLKIVGIELTSMGLVTPEEPGYEEIKKINREKGVYKKIVLKQGKILGAIILGDVRSAVPIKRMMDQGTDVTEWKDFILEDNFDYRKILS
jgi:nitrite reductase (NADH) large subunit